MCTVQQWSLLFVIFITSLSDGHSITTLADTDLKESKAKEYESIFQLFVSNDGYTTSRSLGSDSDDYENKELTTATTKEIFAARSLRAENISTVQPGQQNNTAVSKPMARVNGRRGDGRFSYLSAAPWIHPSVAVSPQRETFPTFYSALVTDDYFLPYGGATATSTKGDWVLDKKTRRWLDEFYVDVILVGSTLDSSDPWIWMWNPPQQPDNLQRYCTKFYKRFGPVCGYKMNQTTWLYEYQTFNDWCALEQANYPRTHTRIRYDWSVLSQGDCTMATRMFNDTWSSQDGYWSGSSMDILLANAQQADNTMLYVKKNYFEYDYTCKTAYGGFFSDILDVTGACYYFSEEKLNFYKAINECEKMQSELIIFDSDHERELLADIMQRFPWDARFQAGYWRNTDTHKSGQYYSVKTDAKPETLVDDLLYNPFGTFLSGSLHDHLGDCVVSTPYERMWNYYRVVCRDAYRYICKRRVPGN